MKPRVDVLIQPICLRFRLYGDELVYLVAANPEMQLDRMELMLGIDPSGSALFDSNLGFLPVASTILVRGERTILVDPGNHHIGAYGMLKHALAQHGLTYDDIDVVVATHSHSDHMASVRQLRGKPLIVGAEELDSARASQGAELDALLTAMGGVIEIPSGDELVPICSGVNALHTPGHTPGSISLLVETDDGVIAIVGDAAMVRSEWQQRKFSHWYTSEQVRQLNESLDRVARHRPGQIIPGHDRAFPA